MFCLCVDRYNLFFLIVTYFLPLLALAITYARVGKQLWGSQAIGERTPGQEETIRTKRRVGRRISVAAIVAKIAFLVVHRRSKNERNSFAIRRIGAA